MFLRCGSNTQTGGATGQGPSLSLPGLWLLLHAVLQQLATLLHTVAGVPAQLCSNSIGPALLLQVLWCPSR